MNIVAIASCSAGVAHTPMAAKSLERAGKELGHNIKVEQQGAAGQVNKITQQEADQADFVLIASDLSIIGMERFKNKPVIRVSIGTCISKPKAVINKCISALQNR